MTLPGPGDPETWGAPTGHTHDPRIDDRYGPCELCSDETDIVIAEGIDADEDGEYGYIVFQCEECAKLLGEMDDDPGEVVSRYRDLQKRMAKIESAAKRALQASQGR